MNIVEIMPNISKLSRLSPAGRKTTHGMAKQASQPAAAVERYKYEKTRIPRMRPATAARRRLLRVFLTVRASHIKVQKTKNKKNDAVGWYRRRNGRPRATTSS